MPTTSDLEALTDAVAALDPQPRERRWVSLSLCVIDAVWSIGARYDAVVVPTVTELARHCGVDQPTIDADLPLPPDPIPLPMLLSRFTDIETLRAVTTDNRTSPRGGIYKADAALRHARVLTDHSVATLDQAQQLLRQPDRLETVDSELRSIPGDGAHGIRRNYLWMLVGAQDLVKPDRMILRWLAHHGVPADPSQAIGVIREITERLTARTVASGGQRRYTSWEIDHAIWHAGRQLATTRS